MHRATEQWDGKPLDVKPLFYQVVQEFREGVLLTTTKLEVVVVWWVVLRWRLWWCVFGGFVAPVFLWWLVWCCWWCVLCWWWRVFFFFGCLLKKRGKAQDRYQGPVASWFSSTTWPATPTCSCLPVARAWCDSPADSVEPVWPAGSVGWIAMRMCGFFAFYVNLADKPAVDTDKDCDFTLFVAFCLFVVFYFFAKRRRHWHETWSRSQVGWSQDQPIRGKLKISQTSRLVTGQTYTEKEVNSGSIRLCDPPA